MYAKIFRYLSFISVQLGIERTWEENLINSSTFIWDIYGAPCHQIHIWGVPCIFIILIILQTLLIALRISLHCQPSWDYATLHSSVKILYWVCEVVYKVPWLPVSWTFSKTVQHLPECLEKTDVACTILMICTLFLRQVILVWLFRVWPLDAHTIKGIIWIRCKLYFAASNLLMDPLLGWTWNMCEVVIICFWLED